MKHVSVCIILLICLANAVEFSSRIKALGIDFAYLVPDYETDLYRNPQILGGKIIGIAYDESETTPINIILSSPRIGFLSRYWLEYEYEFDGGSSFWQSTRDYALHFKDLWMIRVKDDVWNIYNDGFIRHYEIDYAQTYNNYLLKNLEYFLGTQTSFNIGKLNIDLKAAVGFYERVDQYDLIDTYNQRIGIPSGRIGLYYSSISHGNQFLSWFLDFGGPISRADINSLPYSIYSDLWEMERKLKYFGHAFTSRVGWAKAWPLADKGFVVIGLRDEFLYQPTHDYITDYALKAFMNRISLPLAIEYLINKFCLRCGTSFSYDFEKFTQSNDTGLVREYVSHEIDYSYSFGIGWQPCRKLMVDLYNQEYLHALSNWSIYIKYVF